MPRRWGWEAYVLRHDTCARWGGNERRLNRGGYSSTGAARRIGATIARSMAADGWQVVVHYNASERGGGGTGHRYSCAAGGVCGVIQADLSQRADIETLMPRCVEMFGPLDCTDQ